MLRDLPVVMHSKGKPSMEARIEELYTWNSISGQTLKKICNVT